MAQLSIHAKIHSPICPNWFFDPMGGIKLCDLNRSHHFIKKPADMGFALHKLKNIWILHCLRITPASKEISNLWHLCWWNQIFTSIISFFHIPSGRNFVCLFCKYNTFRCMKMLSFWSQKKKCIFASLHSSLHQQPSDYYKGLIWFLIYSGRANVQIFIWVYQVTAKGQWK